jgi:Copper binding proteins, plastocyanin/azurin family
VIAWDGPPPAVAHQAAHARRTPVGVNLSEWDVLLGRHRVRGGRIKLYVTNDGEDSHDLAVRDHAGVVVRHLHLLSSGGRTTARLHLRHPGRYTLFCTLPGHEAKGMHARLRVRRR